MRILLAGSGGREHALAWKLSQSPGVEAIFCAPGNGGTARMPRCHNIALSDGDVEGLVAFAKENAVNLIVPGPELPLVKGLTDAAMAAGIPSFGPVAAAARLEGSKAFAKDVMTAAGVPTAETRTFSDAAEAVAYVRSLPGGMVIKADGLAAGKGVIMAANADEAAEAIEAIMLDRRFGDAGRTVLVEEWLEGEEASLLAFCDGERYAVMPACQDHKRAFDNDQGPNTGGMGAYSPAPVLPDSQGQEVARLVIAPILRELAARGTPFRGVLYAGLMMTAAGPKVLEYNVRFGDPECQPLMMRLDADLAAVMLACASGRLDSDAVRWRPEAAICVVMAAQGYPEGYPKGMAINSLDHAEELAGVRVFHAGTTLGASGQVVSSGGRVLGVCALGGTLAQAQSQAYAAVDRIDFPQSFHRRDIGAKGLR